MIKKKKFTVIDSILFTFSAIFVIDSFGLVLTWGWSSIIWWIILGVLFLLPYGLMIAELGTTYSKDGSGINQWTSNAFGKKAGAMLSWFYWINVAFWMPAVFLVLSDSIIYIANPDFFDNASYLWIVMGVAIVATWITIGVNFLKISDAKWLPNFSAIIKGLIVIILLLVMFISLSYTTESKTFFDNGKALTPQFFTKGSLGIIGIIVYNLAGFELNSNLSSEMKNPKKAILKSILYGGISILVCYIIVTIPVLILVDTQSDAYQDGEYVYAIIRSIGSLVEKNQNFKIFSWIAGVLISLTLFGNMITWTLGANRSLVESAEKKEFPVFLAKKNKNDAPVWAAILTGLISTFAIIIATLMTFFTEGSQLWDTIFSFSLAVFLIPYVFIFATFIKLRKIDKTKREFKAGPNWFASILGIWGIVMIVSAIFLQYIDIYVEDNVLKMIPYEELGGWIGLFGSMFGIIITWLVGHLIIKKQFEKNKINKNVIKNA